MKLNSEFKPTFGLPLPSAPLSLSLCVTEDNRSASRANDMI